MIESVGINHDYTLYRYETLPFNITTEPATIQYESNLKGDN